MVADHFVADHFVLNYLQYAISNIKILHRDYDDMRSITNLVCKLYPKWAWSREISASIVQGSAIGPASYVVTACDLTTITDGNRLCKYADDTYVIIPACNSHTRLTELDHIGTWAARNNLRLNRDKCAELIVSEPRRRRLFTPPPCMSDIKRVTTLTILGVSITNAL